MLSSKKTSNNYFLCILTLYSMLCIYPLRRTPLFLFLLITHTHTRAHAHARTHTRTHALPFYKQHECCDFLLTFGRSILSEKDTALIKLFSAKKNLTSVAFRTIPPHALMFERIKIVEW